MHTKLLALSLLAAAPLFATVASASPNLVTNGNFSQTSFTANNQFGAGFGGQGVTGWTGNGGYNLYFFAGTDTTVSANTQYNSGLGTGKEDLYGPAGGNTSPGGGNFVALDGDPAVEGGISQVINGLTVGTKYLLSFDWGAGQVQSRTGATTEQFQVSLGSQSFNTAVVANPSQSFTGWFNQAFTFTATGASETLNFLSIGTPTGFPPIATLDDVSLTAAAPVPEPASLALLAAGLVGLGFAARRRRT